MLKTAQVKTNFTSNIVEADHQRKLFSKSVHMKLPHCPIILLSASWCSSCALLSMIQISLLHCSCLDKCPSSNFQIHLCCPPGFPAQHCCRHEGALLVGFDLSSSASICIVACVILSMMYWTWSMWPLCWHRGMPT